MKCLVLLVATLGIVNCEISHVGVWQKNRAVGAVVPDLKLVCLNYNVGDVINKGCEEQLNVICQNTTLLSTILDASSKFPYSGIIYSSKMDFGNFDQCLSVDHKYANGRILGEHCAGGLFIPDLFSKQDILNTTSFYILSICRPNHCNSDDLNAILANVTNVTLPLFQDIACQTIENNSKITTTDIVTIAIMSLIVLLMVTSSLYDFYFRQKQLDCPNRLYLAFSVITNGEKLLHVAKHSNEQIQTFDGLKVISMMWIIAGHGIGVWGALPVVNLPHVKEWESKMSSVYIFAAPIAVDTFFFISGFLLAYQYLKQKPKCFVDHVKSIPSLYLHRYLRLTPALAMVFLILLSPWKHLGSGPLWGFATDFESSLCREHWWSLFLYIQNYVNSGDTKMCLPVTWYLCADMQMFLLSPLVMIPVALFVQKPNGFRKSMIQMLVLNVFFIILPLVIKLVFRDYDNEYDTHIRLVDYFLGITMGIFMRVKLHQPFLYMIRSKKKLLINVFIWITVVLGMFAILICYREVSLHHGYETKAVFSALMRPAWCIGLSWVVYACHHGYGGMVGWILCRPIFQILGRLVYSIYLLHLVIILSYVASIRTRWYFSDYQGFYQFCGHLLVTLIVSVFWTLAFELPLISIERVLLGNRGRKEKILTSE